MPTLRHGLVLQSSLTYPPATQATRSACAAEGSLDETAHSRVAVRAFRALLGWMDDAPQRYPHRASKGLEFLEAGYGGGAATERAATDELGESRRRDAVGAEREAISDAAHATRDELIAQLMRQLTANPGEASRARGALLLELALAHWAPSPALEGCSGADKGRSVIERSAGGAGST